MRGNALRLLAALAFATFAQAAAAAVYEYQFSDVLSGDEPSGPAPWATLSFSDVAGGVAMSLSLNASLTGNVREFYFNFDGSASQLDDLTFSHAGGDVATSTQKGLGGFKADGDGYHDILFSYPEGSGFDAGDTSSYLLGGVAGLNAGMFNLKSEPGGGNGTWYAVLHVQNIYGPGTDSAWVGATPIPEPETYLLLLAGLGLLGFAARRRDRRHGTGDRPLGLRLGPE